MSNPVDQRASSTKYRWSILDIAIATAFLSALFALYVNSWAGAARFSFATVAGAFLCWWIVIRSPKKQKRKTFAEKIGVIELKTDNETDAVSRGTDADVKPQSLASIDVQLPRSIPSEKTRVPGKHISIVAKSIALTATAFIVLLLVVLTGLAALMSILATAIAGLFLTSFIDSKLPNGSSLRLKLLTAAVCVLVGLFVWNCFPPPGLQDLLNLRDQFPAVDLTSRLKKVGDPIGTNEMQFDDSRLSHRQQSLELLHSRHYESFIRQAGFGAIRMRSVTRGQLEFEIPLVPLATTYNQFLDEFSPETNFASPEEYINFLALQGHEIPPAWDSHKAAEELFLNDSASGFRPQSRLAAGFVPHGFLFPIPEDNYPAKKWKLTNLELVSLKRFDEPRVYVSKNFPNMKELSSDDIPTRPLNSDEQSMLKMLKVSGKLEFKLASLESAKSLKMLGSLNAKQSCLDCHSGKVGDTLGLFTYEFIPKDTAAHK